MKHHFKRILSLALVIISAKNFAQSDAAGIAGHIGILPTWYCGWNNTTNFPFVLAHKGNQPMLFQTNNTQRLYIDNSAGGVNGNIGIGTMFNTSTRPFSNLHIQQDNNNLAFGGGFRPWMKPSAPGTYSGGTGICISNGDNIWLGLKNKNGVFDQNDAILNWGDNGGVASQGADFMRIVFTNYNGSQPGGSTDGLEITRYAPNSNVGIGDFQVNSQFNPLSKLHIHENYYQHTPDPTDGQSVWMQMTNMDFASAPTPDDGLKIGLWHPLDNNALQTGNAFIYNQENRHLIFSTNHPVPYQGVNTISQFSEERVRITSVGAPTNAPTYYGVYNPANLNNLDLTRVSISHDPANPVTRPMSLLHLGYNTEGIPAGSPDLGGWRPWMDVGTFTNQDFGGSFGGMSMYSGLKIKPFPDIAGEAIISWGYHPTTSVFPTIPTRMRFLFTTNANPTGTTTPISGNTAGIEAAHFWSDGNNTRMGVGDLQTANVDPQNTLEVRSSAGSPYNPASVNGSSGLRFTFLKSTNTPLANGTNGVDNTKVLTVDGNGDVVLTNASGNGIGNICGAATQNPLPNNWEIPLNQHNYVFSGQDTSLDRVGIGTACSPGAKFEVLNTSTFPGFITRASKISALGTAGINIGMDLQASKGLRNIGLVMRVDSSSLTSNTVPNSTGGILIGMAGNRNRVVGIGLNIQAANIAVGGLFQVTSTNKPITGLNIYTASSSPTVGINNVGLNISTQGVASHNYSILATSGNGVSPTYATISNIGVYGNTGLYSGVTAAPGSYRYSFYADALPPTGTTTATNTDYAGFFNGGVYTAQIIFPSDELMKKDMIKVPDALSKLKQLEAISYTFDQDLADSKGLSLPENTQYGFKAQQVASVFPDLVSRIHKPEMKDTLDNIVKPDYDFQGVNYIGFISLLTRGMQQQQDIIDSLQHTSHVKDSTQDAQIQQLMNMINACCQSQQNRGASNNTSGVAQMNIELSDKDAIVLNQNVPNPFAEQTIITYNIPERSGYAQILFSDLKGQIIKVVDIKTKGKGQLNVYANDLSTGMYTYSLYVDGKLFDTKKMVKTE